MGSSLANHGPDGFSSNSGMGLLGGLEAAAAHARATPDHVVGVVLIADGVPVLCTGPADLPDMENAAAAARVGPPSIRTFVLGLDVGGALDGVATSGGTQAVPIPVGAGTDAAIQEALEASHRALTPCAYDLPSPATGTLQPDAVNVQLTPDGGTTSVLPAVADAGSCTGSSWHLDDPTTPTAIELCPDACAAFRADPGSALDIVLGCPTVE